jgi:hypothetical protein
MAYATTLYAGLREVAGNTLEQLDEKSVIRADLMVKYLAAGSTPEVALERINKELDPTNTEKLRIAKDEFAKLKTDKKLKTKEDIVADFDDSALPFTEPTSALSPEEADRLAVEHNRLFEANYLQTRDVAMATEYAKKELKKQYGISKASGKDRVMKFAPEKYYAPDADGSHDYMQTQLKEAVTANYQGEYDSYDLVPNERTANDINGGQPPRYSVVIKTADGLDVLRDDKNQPVDFRFDDTEAKIAKTEAQAGKQQLQLFEKASNIAKKTYEQELKSVSNYRTFDGKQGKWVYNPELVAKRQAITNSYVNRMRVLRSTYEENKSNPDVRAVNDKYRIMTGTATPEQINKQNTPIPELEFIDTPEAGF